MKLMTKLTVLTLVFTSTAASAATAEYKDCLDKGGENSCLSYKVTVPEYSYPGLNSFALSDTFQQSDLQLSNLQAITEQYVKTDLAAAKPGTDNQIEVTWHPVEEAGDYVQISRLESMYSKGAAHGIYGTNYYVFAKNQTDKPILLNDILTTKESKEKLSKILKSLYLIQLTDTGASEAEANDIINSFLEDGKMPVSDNWFFAKEMIVFNYPPYQIGPFSYGSINLAASVNGLGGIIKEDILKAATKCNVVLDTKRY